MCQLDQVGDGIYRIAAYWPQYGISINQFLIDDDQPALIHTGTHQMFDAVHKAICKVLDPKKLKYVIVPHFEADECGGMGRFVKEAKDSTLVCSELGAALNLSGWDFAGPYKGMRDGDRIDLGKHKLRFLETPHVHHWDSMMVVDETTEALFPADLFLQPGEQPHTVRENLGNEMCGLYRTVGIFAAREPVLHVVDRVETMNLKRIHPMHGGSLAEEVLPKYFEALRKERFWYDGHVFGRALMS
jgi:flavorubredoxin